jgi:alpha-galactosidase
MHPVVLGAVDPTVSVVQDGDGIETVNVSFAAPTQPGETPVVAWYEPLHEVIGVWTPTGDTNKGLEYEWDSGRTSRNVFGAPVFSFFGADDHARVTVAVAETMHAVRIRHGVHEEDGTAHIRVYLPVSPCVIRVDRRRLPLADALAATTAWWDARRRHPVLAAPNVARASFYSTWYSFHQDLDEAALREECRRAAALGMAGIIIDDGWQTDDATRGYATCGDWRPHPAKITDIAAFVAFAHGLDLRVLLWFAVPFVGHDSAAYATLRHAALRATTDHAWEQHDRGWIVLDPRCPDARDHVVDAAVRAVREWEVDGLKLDFVDEFATGADTVPFDPTRMDVGTVEEGADLLLFTIRERLTAIRPDVLIEFRQQYVGPDMRAYGNVFRANDCPASALANRVRTIDLRLLSGSTAIHSDMLMWHREDSVESAALQFVSVLFSAPQLSVRLDAQSEGQIAMIRWWLDVFSRYRSVLHRGALRVYGAAANYTRVETVSDAVRVVVLYGEGFVEIGPDDVGRQEVVVVNGSGHRTVAIGARAGGWNGTIHDASGQVIDRLTLTTGAKHHGYPVRRYDRLFSRWPEGAQRAGGMTG